MQRLQNMGIVLILLAHLLLLSSGITADMSGFFGFVASDDCCDTGALEDHSNNLPCSPFDCSCSSCLSLAVNQGTALPHGPAAGSAVETAYRSTSTSDYVRSIEYPPNAG